MNIVVAGGTGFIGSALVRHLLTRGDRVSVLTRGNSPLPGGVRAIPWEPAIPGRWAIDIESADAVVNLAGANIGEGRWTRARKEVLLSSRLSATGALVNVLRRAPAGPRILINASAVGFYGLHDDETLTEESPAGEGFLARLSQEWESAAREAEAFARVVILRFGVVLAKDGGALAKMLVPFRFGVGGKVGSGRQWMSWITRDDVVRAIDWALRNDQARGVYNATAPEPVTNLEFTREVARALRRPAIFPAPAPMLRLAFGEMAGEVLLGGQRVIPRHLEREGFEFESRTLAEGLQRVL